MARKRKTRTRRKRKSELDKSWIPIALIVIGAIFLIWYLSGDQAMPTTPGQTDVPDIPDPVNVGDDIPAEVDLNGDCVSREGAEVGLCCAVWNPTTQQEDWVLCEDLAEQPTGAQAFFTFEGGSTLNGVSSVMFVVRLTNDGNADAGVKISSVDVTATSGGDAASIAEIQTAFENLIEPFTTVSPTQSVEFSMNALNRIRLDIPAGADAFTMADGVYDVTLYIQAQDEFGTVLDAGSRTVSMQVEQEQIMFSVNVESV